MAAPPRLNPDRLRRVDRWLGVPLCFVLTVISKTASLMRGRRSGPPAPPRNVLLIELAEMGTTVLACPAVHRLRSSYPECRVFFLLFKHIDESVKVLNMVPDAHVMTIDVSNAWTILRDTVRLMMHARRQHIDTAINLEVFARFSTILAYVSGARTRVGFHPFTQRGQYIGDLFTHKVNYSPHIHTWQSLLALVKALESPGAGLPHGKQPAATPDECVVPKITTTPEARDRVRQLIAAERPAAAGKRLIAINPNASKLIAIRKWPLDRYAQLVARLLDDAANACVITGLPSERDDAQFILDRVRSDRLVDLTGKTSLRELIDLFNMVDVLVTNDSGPAHFAALTGAHVVVFFGPETPVLYRPLTERCTVMYSDYACSPCVSAYNQRRSVCTDNQCLTHIPVDTVYGTVTDILQRVRIFDMKLTKKQRRTGAHDKQAATRSAAAARERTVTIGAALVVALPLALMSRSESGQYVDPQILYESTLERNPRCWLCYDNLGVLLTADDPESAVLLFRKALAENPDDQDVHYNLGNVLLQLGRVEEGAGELRIAVRTKPQFAEAHDNLGTALARLNNLPGAEREFRLALSLKPSLVGTHANLGRLLAMTGRPAEAVTEYRLVVKAQPDAAEAHFNLANALCDAGQVAEARTEFEQVLALNPGFTAARDGLARCVAKLKGA